MDLVEPSAVEEKNVEAVSSAEDVLVVLQTENGEQIALPISALPSDFVPGDSGQIIMVGGSLDEQQQEQVEHSSSYISTPTTPTTTTTATTINENDATNSVSIREEVSIISVQNSSTEDKPFPRTYSKNSVVKSYAPTCGKTRIYQQPHVAQTPSANQANNGLQSEGKFQTLDKLENMSSSNKQVNEPMTNSNSLMEAQSDKASVSSRAAATIEARVTPRTKQRRKESLLLRPLNEEDMKLEFQIIEEPSSFAQETEVKRKPRKEYRTKKKVRLAMEKLSKEEYADLTRELEQRERDAKNKKQESLKREEARKADEAKKERAKKVDVKKEEARDEEAKKETVEGSRRETPRREITRRANKDKTVESPSKVEPIVKTERRTRLSNTCRVATGKNYKCNDCDFSTDRINNIILHVKESCPKLLKKT